MIPTALGSKVKKNSTHLAGGLSLGSILQHNPALRILSLVLSGFPVKSKTTEGVEASQVEISVLLQVPDNNQGFPVEGTQLLKVGSSFCVHQFVVYKFPSFVICSPPLYDEVLSQGAIPEQSKFCADKLK